MVIVRKPDEGDALLYNLYQTNDFFFKANELWQQKEYNATYKFCRTTLWNRMKFREGLNLEYEELWDSEKLDNGNQRKSIYRYYIYYKCGGIRRDTRMRAPKCVVKYVKQIFPITETDGMLGDHE